MTQRLKFGAFLAPFHAIGEHPTLALERDLELAQMLEQLEFEEFWTGEHHSAGWETIASPEMFLVAAAERTKRIKLGTGVVSIPYHHPFNVAQRLVMLDHLSRGRAMLGVGPGALPSDAAMFGIDPIVLRGRMDEGLGAIMRLLREEQPFSYQGSWFELHDAVLHLRPFQPTLPVAVASTVSPSGMSTAGKYGVGVLSIGTFSQEGLMALPTQWKFGETAAREHGQSFRREDWRIVMPFHVSDSREQACREVAAGLKEWQNDYNVGVLGLPNRHPFEDGYQAALDMDRHGFAIFGSPADAIAKLENLVELSGGFGTVLSFAHEWATQQQTVRSYELIARYVMPRFQGLIAPLAESARRIGADKEKLMGRSSEAVRKAIRDYNATHPRDK